MLVRYVLEMATVPGQLIWEIVKTNNCFLVKQFGRGNAKVQFSKEKNNLCNLNSYKHSGKDPFIFCSLVYRLDITGIGTELVVLFSVCMVVSV